MSTSTVMVETRILGENAPRAFKQKYPYWDKRQFHKEPNNLGWLRHSFLAHV
jgi:hypothetical protein